MASTAHSDPKKLPVPWRERPQRDLHHHLAEWSSGTRGGGSVPKDVAWATNPKEHQEENGSSEATVRLSR